MEWLGHVGSRWGGGCYRPWEEPPNPRRAMHAVLFITRFHPIDSDDFILAKQFVEALRRMLHAKQKELVVAVTHLDECDPRLSTQGCLREYESALGIGVGNVVMLGATLQLPEYAMKASEGLDGTITDEESAADGVYLEPGPLGQLAIALQTACRTAYEQQLKLDDQTTIQRAVAGSPTWTFGDFFGDFCIFASVAFCFGRWCLNWQFTEDAQKAVLLAVISFLCCCWSAMLRVLLALLSLAPLVLSTELTTPAFRRALPEFATQRQLAWNTVGFVLVWQFLEQILPFPAGVKVGVSVVLAVLNANYKLGTILYHQTSEEVAQIILSKQEMKPGSQGLAGAGIYFATTEQLTGHKARRHGVILEAEVDLGKVHTLPAEGDRGMTLQKLRRLPGGPFNSVCIARPVTSGQEYVVYDPSQVIRIRLFKSRA